MASPAAGEPLLIALHGAVGVGKSACAAQLAAELGATGRVEGFVQRALGRAQPGEGAQAYELLFVGTSAGRFGGPLAWLYRADGQMPPYRIDSAAEATLGAWLDALRADPREIDLLLLDEIGQIEARGGGHLQRWQALRALQPAAVLVVVNTARLELVEGVLGQRFDVRIDAASPDALPRLRDVLLARRDFERAGAFGAGAGALELTAGSLVHGAKIPFGGLGMASAQAAVLTRAAAAMNDRARVVWVALLAAGLKSMSPAGQRIGPMVAIAIQGFLYSRALRWLGWNRFAVGVGGFLIGVWVSVQGLLLPWLLLGNALVAGLQGLAGEVARWFGFTAPPLLPLLAAWVLVHGVVGCCATMLAWRQRRDGLPAMPTLGGGLDFESTRDRGWRRALGRGSRDLLRPAFWVPVVLVLIGLLLAGETARSLLAVALRALVVGWVLFVLVQRIDFSALPARLRILGHWGPAIAWRRALSRLQRSRA